MDYQKVIKQMKAHFNQKSTGEETGYYEMLGAVTDELLALCLQVEKIKEMPLTQSRFKGYEEAWHEIISAISEALQSLEELSYKEVKGKKIFEEVDEVFADLEDWIEDLNEENFMQEHPLSYLEAWDIGFFF